MRPNATHDEVVAASPAPRPWLIGASLIVLFAITLSRVNGPSDLWDQTQPRTVAYTTDIIVNDHWVLPLERGVVPATKPPLYNWLAVPFVSWLGFDSELAHKLPSLAAMWLSWLALVWFGERGFGAELRGAGWIAGMFFTSNYAIFKLGYLARPDMLLALWMLIGWMCATATLLREAPASRTMLAAGFWTCVALAALTKGPAALPLVLYGIVGARALGGRFSVVNRLGWWWGAPLAVIPLGVWIFAVWRINPGHVPEQLWINEVYGRFTGTGPEGGGKGWRRMVTGLGDMGAYYAIRFLPWSLLSIVGIAAALRRPQSSRVAVGAAVFVIGTVAMFSISAGKRADYIAPTFGPASLLAAWWVLRDGRRTGRVVAVSCTALAVTAILIVNNVRQNWAPSPDFGDGIMRFAREANDVMATEPRPVALCWTGTTHLAAMLGISEPRGNARNGYATLDRLIAGGEPFWLVSGRNVGQPHDFADWLRTRRPRVTASVRVESRQLPRAAGFPERVTLSLVTP